MIFVTLGSQKFQFNRLLMAIDKLVAQQIIKDNVFAQIGYSDYIPMYYKYKKFLNRDEFIKKQETADIIITHGGTGAIIGALKKRKKVIAVPRMAKYGEHVDDHQLQLINEFTDLNLICGITDCDKLGKALEFVNKHNFDIYISNTNIIIESIEKYLKNNI